MPKNFADRLIMLCVIGLVAWGLIGAPLLYSQGRTHGTPTIRMECDPNCSVKVLDDENILERLLRKPLDDPLTTILAIAAVLSAFAVTIQIKDARNSIER